MKREAWGVYHKQYQLNDKPMTEYDAKLRALEMQKLFKPVEVREVRA